MLAHDRIFSFQFIRQNSVLLLQKERIILKVARQVNETVQKMNIVKAFERNKKEPDKGGFCL